MANHACITIGINQYHLFQPLNYAEADAQALRQFLVEQSGCHPANCLLLTDTSPPIDEQSTYPTRDNIMDWFGEWCQVSQPGAWLWFFFSGYGVSTQGEDYLMPIDGNPADIANTGIPVRELLEKLKQLRSPEVLVMLDINRSQGIQGSESVGLQTVELARQLGITTVLSCEIEQFSHETTTLGHGLFTAALLEALRYKPEITLADLKAYLLTRLPELCQHYWQPVQTPLIISTSPETTHQLIFSNPVSSIETNNSESALAPNLGSSETSNTVDVLPITPLAINVQTHFSPGVMVPYQAGQFTSDTRTPWWLMPPLLWGAGSLVVLGMIFGVLWKVFTAEQAVEMSSTSATYSPAASPLPVAPQTLSRTPFQGSLATLDAAKNMIQPNQASGLNQAIQEAKKIPPKDPHYQRARAEIARWSRLILDIAEARARQGNFSEALAAAQLVPPDQQPVYAQAQQYIGRWQEQAQQQWTNQVVLQAAKGLIREKQASSYNQAIGAATKVLPDQPGYVEAQQLINLWSQKIYQLAQERGRRGEFNDAVETATLVPKNTPDYQAAQKAIAQWKEGKK